MFNCPTRAGFSLFPRVFTQREYIMAFAPIDAKYVVTELNAVLTNELLHSALVGADLHLPKAHVHTHASTTGQTVDDHHNEIHNAVSHSDIASTGAQIDAAVAGVGINAADIITNAIAIGINLADIATNVTAIGLNTTHAGGDGSDHADVAANTAHAADNTQAHSDYMKNDGDTATGDYNFDSNTFVIDSTNDIVGIGTATPVSYHPNANNFVIYETGSNNGLSIISDTNLEGSIFFGDGTEGADRSRGRIIYNHVDNDLSLWSNAVEAITINNSQDVSIPNGFFGLGAPTELTISAFGVIEATKSYHRVDTYENAATDNLDYISFGSDGDILVLQSTNSARDVTLRDRVGNLRLAGNFTMNVISDRIMLINYGDNWFEVSRTSED